MKVIGTGRPLVVYLTPAEFDSLNREAVERGPLMVGDLPIPEGVPVFVNRYIDEGVIVCEDVPASWDVPAGGDA